MSAEVTLLETARLRLVRRDAVAELVLDAAPANEIGLALLGDLEAALARLGALAGDEPIRALLIGSARANAFSAGADLRELHHALERHLAAGGRIADAQAEVKRFLARIHAVMSALDEAPYATIAAIAGVCMGGGFELALACDVRVCDKSARFAFPELRLGLVPGWGGTARLIREGGAALLRDLLVTGRSLGAQRAYELGLVQSPVARGEALATARRMAEHAAHHSPAALAAAKRLTQALPPGALAAEQDAFVALFADPTVRRALARFAASSDVRPYL
jgi:enoyl-CoA hydratase/carnithine racemase